MRGFFLPGRWAGRNLLIALALLSSGVSKATEGGGSNYLPGFYGDMGMAALPEKGTVFVNFYAGYGDRGGNAGAMLEMPGVLHKSEISLLGGKFLVGAFPAVMGVMDRSSSKDKNQVGLGDFYLVPSAIHWNFGNLAILAFEGVVAPTGRYQKGALNLGRNIWTLDHNVMLTWTLPGSNEFSMDLGYMNNLVNHATHFKSGDELHFDYSLGHYLESGLGFGVTGSYYKQLTGDHVSMTSIAVPYSEAATIGPVISFMPKIAGKDVTFSLKWLHEFNVSGRSANEYLVCRTFLEF